MKRRELLREMREARTPNEIATRSSRPVSGWQDHADDGDVEVALMRLMEAEGAFI